MGIPADYVFKPHERPTLPGSPANPDHPPGRQVAYFAIGLLIALTSGLGNAFIQVNLNFVQGSLGLYSDEAAWLTAAYYMTYVTANLVLVKYRQQFGIQSFVRYMLVIYAAAAMAHLLAHAFWTAVLVRAASGVSAAGLTTVGLLYCMQGVPPSKRLGGALIGISVPQIATPLARVVSPRLLDWDDWHMGYLFELGLALAALAAVMTLSLPPSDRTKVFERADALTIALLAPGLWLLVAVLSEGRIYWWTDTPWLGWALACSVAMIAGALVLEHVRANPLINTRWLSTRQMARLIFAAVSVRVLLSEQAYGSVGFLGVFGLINDQMLTLQIVVCLASVAGMIAALLTMNPADPVRPFAIAALLIAIGAWIDLHATNLTRPENFYVSQALIGFAALYFIGPALLTGLARVLLAGPKYFISFIVLFNLSQSLGGLAGTALLGTFQTWREKFHSNQLIQSIVLTDPQVAARIGGTGRALGGVIGDPSLRGAEGAAILAQQATREANVLAFNDVFFLVFVLASLGFAWTIVARILMIRRGERPPLIELSERLKAAAEQQQRQGGAAT